MFTNKQRTIAINHLAKGAARAYEQLQFTRERGLDNATICHQQHIARVSKESRKQLFALIDQKGANTHELAEMAGYTIDKRPNPMGTMARVLVSPTGEETAPMVALHCTYFLQAILEGQNHNEAQHSANARYYK
jgi:hypothetical protein